MKKYKYMLFLVDQFDHRKIEEKLSDMRKEGWELIRIGGIFWKFRRCEPAEKSYAVVHHEILGKFNPESDRPGCEIEYDDFERMCIEAGWNEISKLKNTIVFENDEKDAIPIDTEPEIEFANIKETMKISIAMSFVLVIIGLLFLKMIFSVQSGNLVLMAIGNLRVFSYVALIAIMIVRLTVQGAVYLWWINKSKKSLAVGLGYVDTKILTGVSRYILMCDLLMFAMFVIINSVLGSFYWGVYMISFIGLTSAFGLIGDEVKRRIEMQREGKTKDRLQKVITAVMIIGSLILMFFACYNIDNAEEKNVGMPWLSAVEGRYEAENELYLYSNYYPKVDKIYDFCLEKAAKEAMDSETATLHEVAGHILVLDSFTGSVENREQVASEIVHDLKY